MQGLFFICCPYFWNPHSFFVCVQTKQIQGVIKRPRRERRGRERTEKRERRGRESGLLEGEVEEHGRCLPSLTFCSSSLLRWGGGIALSPQVVSPLFFLFLSAAVLARLSFPRRVLSSCRDVSRNKEKEAKKFHSFGRQCRRLPLPLRGPARPRLLLLPPRARRSKTARRFCRVSSARERRKETTKRWDNRGGLSKSPTFFLASAFFFFSPSSHSPLIPLPLSIVTPSNSFLRALVERRLSSGRAAAAAPCGLLLLLLLLLG